jgi:hypothetical protein
MDIIEIAVASGMQVTLDGRIGTQEYRSVYGSLQALRRFADAVMLAAPFLGNLAVLTEDEGQPVSSTFVDHESEQ